MKLEEEIKQSHFRNEYQKAMINLAFTQYRFGEKVKTIFDRFGLTPQQFNILRILRGAKHPMSTLQIRERMLDRMSDTSRIVDRLVAKQLVAKSLCPTDKRLVDVTITNEGKKVLQQLDGCSAEMDDLLHGLSEAEAVQLNQLLDKARAALS